MIASLLDYLRTNQFLIGGIGTVLFGFVMYLVRGVPVLIFKAAKQFATIEFSLTSDVLLYHEMLDVLSNSAIKALSRSYTTDGMGQLVSGFGTSVALFGRRLIIYSRALKENSLRRDERLTLTVFGRNRNVLKDLIRQASRPRSDDVLKVYLSSPETSGYWLAPSNKRKRSLDTVFANRPILETLVERIDWFLSNEDWYARRGIHYKLVVLLYGPPGTGKSSLIYGLASHFSHNVGVVSSLNGVDHTLRNMPEKSFAAIEDIDLITINREDHSDPSETTLTSPIERQLNALQKLINSLDGLATPHGLILFITTNFKERLDSALIRPGRVDCHFEVGPLGAEATEAMFTAFYGKGESELIRAYVNSPSFQPHTGAYLQSLFMTTEPQKAVRILSASASDKKQSNLSPVRMTTA